MKRMSRIVAIAVALLLLPKIAHAQDISQIAKSDPLIITGAVGTQNTYYRSSYGDGYASPLSNSVFASLNISAYGFSIPLSFYYSNSNLDFNYPYFSFNASPTYKRWTLHLGQRTMPFSNYIYNIPFNGVGMEYNGDKLRVGLFYGKLRKAINDDPLDPLARTPQYSRFGWGFKVGYGSTRNFIDIFVFRAKDHVSSIDELWRNDVFAQENLVIGARGRVTVTRWLSLTGNIATSALSTDITAKEIEKEAIRDFGDIFNPRYSSLMRFAGDVSANMHIDDLSASISYRMIEPDYYTLGTSYMTNNIHSLGISASTQLFKTLNLTANFSGQEDNLTNQQLYTTRGFVYSLNASSLVNNKLSLAFDYNGYTQNQSDGTEHVNDTTRISRVMHSFTFTPSYSVYNDEYSHTVSLASNYTMNINRNELQKKLEEDTDINTLALGAGYTLGLIEQDMDLSANYSYQQTKGMDRKYSTHVFSVGAARSFLEEKNLQLSGNISLSRNNIQGMSKNISLGGDVSAAMNIKDKHAISFSASYSRFNDTNLYDEEVADGYNGYDLMLSLNYIYTFSLLEIKKKGSKENKEM